MPTLQIHEYRFVRPDYANAERTWQAFRVGDPIPTLFRWMTVEPGVRPAGYQPDERPPTILDPTWVPILDALREEPTLTEGHFALAAAAFASVAAWYETYAALTGNTKMSAAAERARATCRTNERTMLVRIEVQ